MPLRSLRPPKVKIALCGAAAAREEPGVKRRTASTISMGLNQIRIDSPSTSFLLVKRIDKTALIELLYDRDIDKLLRTRCLCRGGSFADFFEGELDSLDRRVRLPEKNFCRIVIAIFDLFRVVALGVAGNNIHGKFFIGGEETHSFDHALDEPLDGFPRLPHKLSCGHDVAVQRFDT